MKIVIAHSPDPDDAFMFYALAHGKVGVGGIEFEHQLGDIESLNQAAREGRYEISAVSIHAYAHLMETYQLLDSGASMGDGYGPILVSRAGVDPTGRQVAIPGKLTTAALLLKLYMPSAQPVVMKFDEILDAVKNQEVAGGVIIHEGQLTYGDFDLEKVVDFGAWWKEQTGGPLPLGGNVIRRDLGPNLIQECARAIKSSIRYGLDHRQEALDYAIQFGRDLDRPRADRFVGMYVNEYTLDYGEDGRRAVQELLNRGGRAGLIPEGTTVSFTE